MSFQEIPTQSRFHTSEGNCCSFSLQSVEAAASWETRSAYQPSLLWEDLSLCRYQTEILCGKAGLHFCHIVCPVWEGKIRLGLSPLMSQPMDKQFILAHLHASCWKFEKWPGNLSLQAAWLPRLSWWGADPVEREVVFQSTCICRQGSGSDTKEYAYICSGEVGDGTHILSLHLSPRVEQFCFMVVWLHALPIQVLCLDSAVFFFLCFFASAHLP